MESFIYNCDEHFTTTKEIFQNYLTEKKVYFSLVKNLFDYSGVIICEILTREFFKYTEPSIKQRWMFLSTENRHRSLNSDSTRVEHHLKRIRLTFLCIFYKHKFFPNFLENILYWYLWVPVKTSLQDQLYVTACTQAIHCTNLFY